MREIKEIKALIQDQLEGGDILLIVPPIAMFENPVLGVHILQALAREKGYKAEVLYLNVLLASIIGFERNEYITFSLRELPWMMLHERLFARAAYGLPQMGRSIEHCFDEAVAVSGGEPHNRMFYTQEHTDLGIYRDIENLLGGFLDETAAAIAKLNYKMIGCSVRMGQVNCTVALTERIKELQPGVITLVGGSNCEDQLADGIASITPAIDYIFSGESETTFPEFLGNLSEGNRPKKRIIRGTPIRSLDPLPMPEYKDFFQQIEGFIDEPFVYTYQAPPTTEKDAPAPSQDGEASAPRKKLSVAVSYEASRGCWWGEKHKCRFCGSKIRYREKETATVVKEITELQETYPGKPVYCCDSIMPTTFAKEVLPALNREKPGPNVCIMIKTGLNFKTLLSMRKNNLFQITPGIEALSTPLLKLMSKGCTAAQNIRLLRDAYSAGLPTDYLLLWGFPNDKIDWYKETLHLLPLLHHLQPPIALMHCFLSRFSHFFDNAAEYSITNMRPWKVYGDIYPDHADLENLAFWFVADYPCESHDHRETMKTLTAEVDRWKSLWQTTHLVMIPFNESFIIMDNRPVRGKKQDVVDAEAAREIMTASRDAGTPHRQWAVEQKLGLLADGWYIPLITASPDLMLQFES